jgi:hypothetical protein
VRGGEDNFGYWFSGHVNDPQFYISRQDLNPLIQIKFETGFTHNYGDVVSTNLPASTEYMYFDFESTEQYGLGYIKPVEFTFNLGPDVSTTWE